MHSENLTFRTVTAVFLMLTYSDVCSTLFFAYKRGIAFEANPFIRSLWFLNPSMVLLWGLAEAVFFLCLFKVLVKLCGRVDTRWFLMGFVVIFTCVVARNLLGGAGLI